MITMLYILLEHAAHPIDADSITFTAMQVGTIIGGALGIAGGYFANKYEIQQLKVSKSALKKAYDKENEERKAETDKLEDLMNKRVDAANARIEKLGDGIGSKLDGVQSELKALEIKIGDNHQALLQALLNNRK